MKRLRLGLILVAVQVLPLTAASADTDSKCSPDNFLCLDLRGAMGTAATGVGQLAKDTGNVAMMPVNFLVGGCTNANCSEKSEGALGSALNGAKSLAGGLFSAIGGLLGLIPKALGSVSSAIMSPLKSASLIRQPTLLERIAAELIPLRSAMAAPGVSAEQRAREMEAYETVERGDPLEPSQLSGVRKEIGETLLAVSDAQQMVKDFQKKLAETNRTIAALEAQKAKVEARRAGLASADSREITKPQAAKGASAVTGSSGDGAEAALAARSGGKGGSDVTGTKDLSAGSAGVVRGLASAPSELTAAAGVSGAASGPGNSALRSATAAKGAKGIDLGVGALRPGPEAKADPEKNLREGIRSFLDESEERLSSAGKVQSAGTPGALAAATDEQAATAVARQDDTIFHKVHKVYESRRRSGLFSR